MRSLLRLTIVLATLDACSHAPPTSAPPTAPSPPTSPAVPSEIVVSLAGGGNALWWDAASATLYLTDSNASALVAWTEAGGLAPVATVPAGTAGVSLGGVVRRADGTTIVANFGFGTQGGLFAIAADHTVTALTGLEPTRRRVGLAQEGGVLYSAYFVGDRGKSAIGGVATVAITGGAARETEIAGASTSAGFGKIVGVVATPGAVFVADQTQKTIWKLALPGFAVSKLADVPGADLLAVLPDGDLLTGGGPVISRITQAGVVSTVPGAGFEQVRGLAYDPAGQRLFIIDHSLTPGSPDQLRIRHLAR
ncbi:MAG: hypothetical protein ABIY55_16940 [Kofleriaceae bacterium]